jgi:molecular chaperone GrpE
MTEESAKQGLAGQEPEDLAKEAAEDLDKLQAEVDEHRDRYMRLAAEMDNLRKRAARETDQARQFGIERFAGELLGVVDSLEMGVAAGAESTAEALLEGSQATLRLLLGAMDKHGVQVVDPDGEPFDPQFHEAIATQPSATAEPGSVLIVVQKGYSLNGRLLRPARVIVAAAQDS